MQTTTMKDCPKCGTDLAPYMALPKPPAFCLQCKFPLMLIAGKYRLDRVLGEGGFGTVYLARHVRLTRNAERVVKLIKPDIFQYEGMDKRFMREVQVTSDLSQRNEHIVRIYDDFGEEPHLGHFYVMEYLQGLSLLDYVNKPGLLPAMGWTFSIFEQLCDAIQAAHEEDIIHRDLKPENILLIKRRKHPYFVKVLDFGIAKPMGAANETKLTQGALGTPYYMSPEQTVNRPVDARSDIYAMGIMLYEMLTGAHPFIPKGQESSISAMELMSAHMMTDMPNPCDAHPERQIPPGVGLAILKASAKEPENRYQSVEEFWADIERSAGALAKVKPEDLPDLLPRELRQTPSEQIREATSAFAKTMGTDEIEPGLLQDAISSRMTPSSPGRARPGPDAMTRDANSGPISVSRKPRPPAPMATGKIVSGKKGPNPLVWGLLVGLLIGGVAVGVFIAKKFRAKKPTTITARTPARTPAQPNPARRDDALGLPPSARRDIPDASPTRVRPAAPVRRAVAPPVRIKRRKPVKRRKFRRRVVRRRWVRKRPKPRRPVVRAPAANPDACPKPGWVRLKIRPCSNGRGAVAVQGAGLGRRKTKDICVPPGKRVSIEQVRCSICVFSPSKSPAVRNIYLKNSDEVEFDTGKACLKP